VASHGVSCKGFHESKLRRNVEKTQKGEDMKELNVSDIVPKERHPLIFRTFDDLKEGESFILINKRLEI